MYKKKRNFYLHFNYLRVLFLYSILTTINGVINKIKIYPILSLVLRTCVYRSRTIRLRLKKVKEETVDTSSGNTSIWRFGWRFFGWRRSITIRRPFRGSEWMRNWGLPVPPSWNASVEQYYWPGSTRTHEIVRQRVNVRVIYIWRSTWSFCAWISSNLKLTFVRF